MTTLSKIASVSLLLLPRPSVSLRLLRKSSLPTEGKRAVQEGEGGAKKTVEGIDFWSEGAPPKKFKILGFINDRRHKSGLVGMISMSNLESSVAEVAKKNGGEAVILVASGDETIGVVGNSFGGFNGNVNSFGNNTSFSGNGWQMGAGAAVKKQNSKFVVVKYLVEETPEADTLTKVDEQNPQSAMGRPVVHESIHPLYVAIPLEISMETWQAIALRCVGIRGN